MTFQGLPSKLHAQLGCRRSGGVSRLARGTRSRVPGGQAVGQPRPEPSSPALLPQLSGEGRDGDAGETWARGAVKILLRVQPPPVMRPRTGGFSPRRAHRCSLPPPPAPLSRPRPASPLPSLSPLGTNSLQFPQLQLETRNARRERGRAGLGSSHRSSRSPRAPAPGPGWGGARRAWRCGLPPFIAGPAGGGGGGARRGPPPWHPFPGRARAEPRPPQPAAAGVARRRAAGGELRIRTSLAKTVSAPQCTAAGSL